MKMICIRVACIILILLYVIQVGINIKFSKTKEEVSCVSGIDKNSSIKYKTLSKLNSELSSLKMCNIIGASNDGDKWKVKVKISGDKMNILNEIINLQKYEITSYHMVKNDVEEFILLEMYGIE